MTEPSVHLFLFLLWNQPSGWHVLYPTDIVRHLWTPYQRPDEDANEPLRWITASALQHYDNVSARDNVSFIDCFVLNMYISFGNVHGFVQEVHCERSELNQYVCQGNNKNWLKELLLTYNKIDSSWGSALGFLEVLWTRANKSLGAGKHTKATTKQTNKTIQHEK